MNSKIKLLKTFFIIIRPLNALITFLVIATAIILSGASILNWQIILLPSLIGAIVASAGMIINDIFDQEIDKINRPERVLPSKLILEKTAYKWYFILNGIALIMTLNLPVYSQTIVYIALFLIYFYSAHLKKSFLFGNLNVAGLTGLAFIFGGSITGNYSNVLLPALFAFLINIAREIVKDFEDMEGDLKENAKTFPIKFGKLATQIFVTIILLLLIYSTNPILKNIEYIYFVSALIYLPIAISLFYLWKDCSKNELHKVSTILKYTMLAGLIIIFSL